MFYPIATFVGDKHLCRVPTADWKSVMVMIPGIRSHKSIARLKIQKSSEPILGHTTYLYDIMDTNFEVQDPTVKSLPAKDVPHLFRRTKKAPQDTTLIPSDVSPYSSSQHG
jgi:hypothetical protein